MAPMIQAAAVCLVALCSLHSAQASAVQALDVQSPDELLLAVNLARAGKLSTALVQVKHSDALVATAKAKIASDVQKESCLPQTNPNKPAVQLEGMVLRYTLTSRTTPNYKKLVQDVLTQGLNALSTQPALVTSPWSSGLWTENEAAANMGYLLWSSSVSVGCAVTTGCDSQAFLILCHFTPTAGGAVVPFDENVYNALKARTTQLTEMSKGDLQGPGSGATMGVPSLLLAGFVAALAMVTV